MREKIRDLGEPNFFSNFKVSEEKNWVKLLALFENLCSNFPILFSVCSCETTRIWADGVALHVYILEGKDHLEQWAVIFQLAPRGHLFILLPWKSRNVLVFELFSWGNVWLKRQPSWHQKTSKLISWTFFHANLESKIIGLFKIWKV